MSNKVTHVIFEESIAITEFLLDMEPATHKTESHEKLMDRIPEKSRDSFEIVFNEASYIEYREKQIKKINKACKDSSLLLEVFDKQSDRVGIYLDLNFGRIDGDFVQGRFEASTMFSDTYFDYSEQDKDGYYRAALKFKEQLDYIVESAKEGDTIVLWNNRTVGARLSIDYILYLLKDIDFNVIKISLPDGLYIRNRGKEKQEIISWGQLNSLQVANNLTDVKLLEPSEKESAALEWEEISKDTSTLRIIKNGKIVGVPLDYFDEMIYSMLPDVRFCLSKAAIDIAYKDIFGIYDFEFFYSRMRFLVREGKLVKVRNRQSAFTDDCFVIKNI